MDKIKKYAKMMIDEILSAEQYANMCLSFKDKSSELSDDYADMAKQELHHKDIIAKTLKHYITTCEEDKGEKCEDMECVYDFVCDICVDMETPILAKLKS